MPPIADERYVRLTTFTRDGRPKHVPVWIAALEDGSLGFTTELESWKVRRIRATPEVELVACSMRGDVRDGATPETGRAEIRTGDAAEAVRRAIRAKYGWQVAAIDLGDRLRRLVGRPGRETCAVVIELAG